MQTVLSFENVTKRYGGITAVSELSFAVRPGEMFGLIGPDGAGKTTTIRLLCGLLHADGGTVRVMGHDPVREHARVTSEVGYLSQRFSLYGDLSIDENIAFFAEIHDVWNYAERRTRLLELTGLLPFRSRLADRLSGGMKQKLALACTLVHEPRVILLDEPTTGVDPVSRREFWILLNQLHAEGLTLLVSTPYMDEAEYASRLAFLDAGRLTAVGSREEILAAFPRAIVEVRSQDRMALRRQLSALPSVDDVSLFGTELHVRGRGQDAEALRLEITRALGTAVGEGAIRPIGPSLEDVFVWHSEQHAGAEGQP
jgi:ABC-2 type transport system ATP-binding protein